MNKTMLKLVWSLTVIVVLIGIVRLVMISNGQHSGDQKIMIDKSK